MERMRKVRLHVLTAAMAGFVVLAGAAALRAQTQEPQAAPQSPEVAELAESEAGMVPASEIPFYPAWRGSPHADRTAEAFTHWDEEGAVEADCAKCHSGAGFVDYLGGDGTAAFQVDHPAPLGTVITCTTCHNEATRMLHQVTFPSGVTVEKLGPEARCMTCHQGRESTDSVRSAVGQLGDDEVSADLGFINVHYAAAGATLMGDVVRGGYQYEGKGYAGRYEHRAPYDTCTSCHSPHSTEVRVSECGACHKETTGEALLHMIRSSEDKTDYDGDGDATEGIAGEIATLHEKLLAAIKLYASDVAGTAIAYDGHNYPYFFIDTNGDGSAGEDEARFPNKYNAWTPRLLKAAYNYQFVAKDPGAFAHNPPYALQILYDSLEDLGGQVDVAMNGANRP